MPDAKILGATAEDAVIRDHVPTHNPRSMNWHISENVTTSNPSGSRAALWVASPPCLFHCSACLSLAVLSSLPAHLAFLSVPISPVTKRGWQSRGLSSLTIVPTLHHFAAHLPLRGHPRGQQAASLLTGSPLLVCLFNSNFLHFHFGQSSVAHFNFSCLFP